MSFCKNCGKTAIVGGSFCPYCGMRINEGKNYCPNCGKQTIEDAPFCPYCGIKVAVANIDALSGNEFGGMAGKKGDSAPPGTVCSLCGEPLQLGQLFCGNCGTVRLGDTDDHHRRRLPKTSEGRMLTISRSGIDFGSDLVYEVLVEDTSLGELRAGGCVSTKEFPDRFRLDLRCKTAGIMACAALLSGTSSEPTVFVESYLNEDLVIVTEVSGDASIETQSYYNW